VGDDSWREQPSLEERRKSGSRSLDRLRSVGAVRRV
jgi:hypothetical protein